MGNRLATAGITLAIIAVLVGVIVAIVLLSQGGTYILVDPTLVDPKPGPENGTANTQPQPVLPEEDEPGLSLGAWIGIGIGCAFAVGLLVFVAATFFRRPKYLAIDLDKSNAGFGTSGTQPPNSGLSPSGTNHSSEDSVGSSTDVNEASNAGEAPPVVKVPKTSDKKWSHKTDDFEIDASYNYFTRRICWLSIKYTGGKPDNAERYRFVERNNADIGRLGIFAAFNCAPYTSQIDAPRTTWLDLSQQLTLNVEFKNKDNSTNLIDKQVTLKFVD